MSRNSKILDIKITSQKAEWPPFVYALKPTLHKLPPRALLYNCQGRGFSPHIFSYDLGIWKWERKAEGNFLQSSLFLPHGEKGARRLVQELRWEIVKNRIRKEGLSKHKTTERKPWGKILSADTSFIFLALLWFLSLKLNLVFQV